MFVLETQDGPVARLALGHRGRLLIQQDYPSRVAFWDLGDREYQGDLDVGGAPMPWLLTGSPTGLTAVTAHRNSALKYWCLGTLRELATLTTSETAYVGCLAYSGDGKHLLAGALRYPGRGADVEITRWDLATFRAEPCGTCHVSYRWRGSMSLALGDRVLVAVGDRFGGVTVCSPGKRNVRVALPGRRAFAQVWFSPDARTLAILRDKTVRLWDVATRRVRASWTEKRQINTLAFAPGSGMLATGSRDGTVSFRDVATGKERASFDWRLGAIRAIAFSPDGMLAAAGSEGGQVVVWDVDQG
jgi:WD40 repeat protein